MKLARRSVFATVVLVIVVAVILGRDPGGILPSGHADTARPGAQTTVPSTARDGPVDQPFDYFPDHFANQAKEPAEPIASF